MSEYLLLTLAAQVLCESRFSRLYLENKVIGGTMEGRECLLCRGFAGDSELHRIQVWEDALWRLTVSLEAEVSGFAYLEPKRHVPTLPEAKLLLVSERIRSRLVTGQLA